jgi:hypothetical protein
LQLFCTKAQFFVSVYRGRANVQGFSCKVLKGVVCPLVRELDEKELFDKGLLGQLFEQGLLGMVR